MVLVGDISHRKTTRHPKRRKQTTKTTKNAKTVRKRTARRVGNVSVSVSDLHNIFLYIFTRHYTNSSVKQ